MTEKWEKTSRIFDGIFPPHLRIISSKCEIEGRKENWMLFGVRFDWISQHIKCYRWRIDSLRIRMVSYELWWVLHTISWPYKTVRRVEITSNQIIWGRISIKISHGKMRISLVDCVVINSNFCQRAHFLVHLLSKSAHSCFHGLSDIRYTDIHTIIYSLLNMNYIHIILEITWLPTGMFSYTNNRRRRTYKLKYFH